MFALCADLAKLGHSGECVLTGGHYILWCLSLLWHTLKIATESCYCEY